MVREAPSAGRSGVVCVESRSRSIDMPFRPPLPGKLIGRCRQPGCLAGAGPATDDFRAGLRSHPAETRWRVRPSEEAQAMETKTHINRVGRVCVPVADQDRAIDFYVNTLGFEKRADITYGNGERWVEVAPPGATTAIALVPPMAGNPTGTQTGIALTTQDIDAV